MTVKLSELHKLCLEIQDHALAHRLKILADCFIGTKYGPWPDGSSFETLDDFDYRLEMLDCVTFVEIVLALAKTQPLNNFTEFKQKFENVLRLIHYANGRPNFVSRNHFMSVDWILNNKFLVEDITSSLSKNAKMAEALIDKLSWIKRHKISNSTVNLPLSVMEKFQPQISRLPYIETDEFLGQGGQFYNNFPEYSIVNIVRPNWDLRDKIGTHLNVSHLGFTFKESSKGSLLFYHASNDQRAKVVKDTLHEYMERSKESPSIRGINVLIITPGYHHTNEDSVNPTTSERI